MKNINLNRVIKSKEDKIMRTLGIIIIISLFLASCSSSYDASAPYDEVYASGSEPAKVKTESVTVRSQTVESTTTVEGEYYSPEYEEGEFDSEGYYDYEYSSRIKRFGDENPGFDYYSNYYTDNYYYTNDPYYIGSNIYSGCGYCSGVSLSFGYGYGWGYPYYGWGYPYYSYRYPWYYDPWYYPYYGWGYGYSGYWGGSYWAGYYDGYWNGYWDGYYWGGGGYYPEPSPGGGHYYGHRNSRGGSSNGSNVSGTSPRDQRTGNDDVQVMNQSARGVRTDGNVQPVNAVGNPAAGQPGNKEDVLNASARGDRGEGTPVNPPGTSVTKTDVLGNQPTYNKPAEAASRTVRTSDETVKPGQNTSMSESRRVQPEMKYEKPKTYTSPSYRTTPSKQEYSSPSSRESRPVSGQGEGETRKVYSTTPERKINDGGSRPVQESGPSKLNAVTPSQKYTSPSRSNERSTYSSPSNSGSRSYSAPSRSYSPSYNSGSSGGSRSSGGGGGSTGGGSSSGSSGGGSRGVRR